MPNLISAQHPPWQLFCEDLEFAKRFIKNSLNNSDKDKSWLGQLGQFALSLGEVDVIQSRIKNTDTSELNETETAHLNALRFRISRLSRQSNPYQYLVDTATKELINDIVSNSKILKIALQGGIGDYLEDLSLFVPWAQEQDIKLKLITRTDRVQNFNQLSANVNCIEGFADGLGLVSFGMRWWLNEHSPTQHEEWIKNSPSPKSISIKRNQLLCCWKAEAKKDTFSAYCRSIPFHQVLQFYKSIAEINPLASIVDITSWSNRERAILHHLDIKFIEPREVGLTFLKQLLKDHLAITIDTALIHLCASSGSPGILLASFTHDERWLELMSKEGCYKQNIRFLRSNQFGSFEKLLKDLPRILQLLS